MIRPGFIELQTKAPKQLPTSAITMCLAPGPTRYVGERLPSGDLVTLKEKPDVEAFESAYEKFRTIMRCDLSDQQQDSC